MKNTRPALAAVVAVTAALLFSGCASGSTSDTAANDCDTLRSDVRDISNGAQNTLAGDLSEAQDDAKKYLEGLNERIDSLEKTWESNEKVTAALETLGDKVDSAEEFVDSVPTDGSEIDADAQAAASGDIADAAAAVNEACTAATK
ncbi:MAG: hypothetical protein ABWY36_07010 [Leifsonia sp.]